MLIFSIQIFFLRPKTDIILKKNEFNAKFLLHFIISPKTTWSYIIFSLKQLKWGPLLACVHLRVLDSFSWFVLFSFFNMSVFS